MPNKVTPTEAFILLQKSHFDDCANSVCGLLKCFADRVDPNLEDNVQGNVAVFMRKLAQRLRDNNEKSHKEIIEFIGEDRYKEIQRQLWNDITLYEAINDKDHQS